MHVISWRCTFRGEQNYIMSDNNIFNKTILLYSVYTIRTIYMYGRHVDYTYMVMELL